MLRNIINFELVSVEPDAKIADAARLMAEKNIGAVLVLDDDKPRGILTDRDIAVRCVAQNLDVDDTTVENVMTESLETCKDTDGLFTCIERMRNAQVRRMPVVDDSGKAVGIISFGDILGILGREIKDATETTTFTGAAGEGGLKAA